MSYKYSALKRSDEIRLIELLPGEFDGDIQLLIHHTTLERPHGRTPLEEIRKNLPQGWYAYETVEGKILYCRGKSRDDANESFNTTWTHPDPEFDSGLANKASIKGDSDLVANYEALSYVWGLAQPTYTIYVGSMTLQVRGNLLSALRHLRNRDSSRILWTDVICIDQENPIERGDQVRSMGDIYKMAKRVVIWLGPELDDSKIAFQTLEFLGQQVEICTDGAKVNAPGCQQPTWYSHNTLLPYNERTWQAIYAFLSRPWFNRLWVWQEAKLASKDSIVHCGHDWTGILTFYKAVLTLSFNQKLPRSNLQLLAAGSARILRPHSLQPYETVLPYLSLQGCFDPRDKIYGGLGVAPPMFRTLIKPDYSLTVADVYRQAFIVWAQYTHRLDLLSYCQLGVSQLEKPSWVPDWSVLKQLSPQQPGFQASGISRAQTKLQGSSVLEVSAVAYDTVSYVSSRVCYRDEESLRVASRWKSKINIERNYITGQNNLDAFVSMICKGNLKEKFPNSSLSTLQEWKDIFLDATSQKDNAYARQISISTMSFRVPRHSFFITRNGYMGLGPARVNTGDIISIILGSSNPIILRPIEGNEFKVAGGCYIQGLMDAEGLLGPLPPNWRAVVVIDNHGLYQYQFFNHETGEVTIEDPRLGILPSDWERLEAVRTENDPCHFARFRNTSTGENINADPRLLPEALKARGVDVRTIQLI